MKAVLCFCVTVLLGILAGSVNATVAPSTVTGLNGTTFYYRGGDEFNPTDPSNPKNRVDTRLWIYDLGYIANNEAQYYTPDTENAYVGPDGNLHIIGRLNNTYAGYNYTSARITTRGKACVNEGSWVQVRAKIPSGIGTWPAIWLLGPDWVDWPANGELDIMEAVGHELNKVWHSGHSETKNSGNGNPYTKLVNIPDMYAGYHTFELQWRADALYFMVDGNVTYTVPKNASDWPFRSDRCFELILNLAIGGTWGGEQGINNTIFPVDFQVDYVRVYHQDSTYRFYNFTYGSEIGSAFALQKCGNSTTGWGRNSLPTLQTDFFTPYLSNLTNLDGCSPTYIYERGGGYLYQNPGGSGKDLTLTNDKLMQKSGSPVPSVFGIRSWTQGRVLVSTDCCTVRSGVFPTAPATIAAKGITNTSKRIVIPGYFYPTDSNWTLLTSNAPDNATFAFIINPNSGPGTSLDGMYLSGLKNLQDAGYGTIGYVYTSYGARAASAVLADVDRYLTFYPAVEGIFLDEASDSDTQIPYYTTLYQGIVSRFQRLGKKSYVMLNPGTNCSEAYMNISDSIVIFENPYSTFSTWYPPAWAGKYDSGRLCVMLTGCPASPSFIPQTIQKLQANNVGLWYLTNLGGNNPYLGLPSYWNDEVGFTVNMTQSGSSSTATTAAAPTLAPTSAPSTSTAATTSTTTTTTTTTTGAPTTTVATSSTASTSAPTIVTTSVPATTNASTAAPPNSTAVVANTSEPSTSAASTEAPVTTNAPPLTPNPTRPFTSTARPTPFPSLAKTPPPFQKRTILNIVVRITGSQFQSVLDTKRSQLSNAVKADLSRTLKVPASAITINSLTVGSLIVDATVSSDSGVTADEANNEVLSQGTAGFSETAATYAAAGATDNITLVSSTTSDVTPQTSSSGGMRCGALGDTDCMAMIVAICIGGGLLLLAALVVCIRANMKKKDRQAALAKKQGSDRWKNPS